MNPSIDEEDKGGHESDSEDSMIGAESQLVIDMCDTDGERLAGNNDDAAVEKDAVADSVPSLAKDGGSAGNDVVADSVPSLAKHDDAVTSATEAGGDTAPMVPANAVVKNETDDSATSGNESPPVAKHDATAATATEADEGITPIAPATTAVKHETPESATSGNESRITPMAAASTTVVKHETDDSATSSNESRIAPISAASTTVVKHEADNSATSRNEESSLESAKAKAGLATLVEREYRMRNVKIGAFSTDQIREGNAKTTFSIHDFGFSKGVKREND